VTDALNQAEVDALLRRSPSAPRSGPRGATGRYDFSHPDLLSRDQSRAVRTLHEGYAQALAKRLSTELLTNVSASVAAVDSLTYAEFLMLLPSPTVLAVVEVEELDGSLAIEIDPSLSFAFIDRLLGGVGAPLRERRPLTGIEQGLMERVIRRCCVELELVWRPIASLEFRLQSIEANPELARVVGPDEMILLVTLELRMNEAAGALHLCLPHVVMEPALHLLGQGTRHPRRAGVTAGARDALRSSLRSSRVRVDVDLGTTDVSLRELLELAPGDVLRTQSPADGGAEAKVEGVARLVGAPGRSRGRLAFEVGGTTGRSSATGGDDGSRA